jgi:Protein of unknown function, DUF547
MKRLLVLLLLAVATPLLAQEPDYTEWNRLLKTYYDPARGMDYAGLKAKDNAALQKVRQQLGRANAGAMNPKQQLAYWINVYNVNSVATIVEGYPVKSIRDLSTDPIIRLNVFKKDRVPAGGALISLDNVENEKIRKVFNDPRIHFAINCAAKSCPPIRPEAYTGAMVDAQLDDQTRRFMNSVRFAKDGNELDVHVTKIMDWFTDDFDKYPGGKKAFVRKYVAADKQAMLDAARDIDWEYDDYDWALNDWRR